MNMNVFFFLLLINKVYSLLVVFSFSFFFFFFFGFLEYSTQINKIEIMNFHFCISSISSNELLLRVRMDMRTKKKTNKKTELRESK